MNFSHYDISAKISIGGKSGNNNPFDVICFRLDTTNRNGV